MNSNYLFLLVTTILSIIGILAAYMSSITYRLSFHGVLGILILTGLFNSLAMRMINLKGSPESILGTSLGSLLISIIGAIITFIILANRFGFLKGISLGVIAGIITSLINYVVKSG